MAYISSAVLVQTRSEMVLGKMGLPRPETKPSCVFGKIPDWDWDCGVWSGPDWVPISLAPNFPNTKSHRSQLLPLSIAAQRKNKIEQSSRLCTT